MGGQRQERARDPHAPITTIGGDRPRLMSVSPVACAERGKKIPEVLAYVDSARRDDRRDDVRSSSEIRTAAPASGARTRAGANGLSPSLAGVRRRSLIQLIGRIVHGA
jgi:hypothetical protein